MARRLASYCGDPAAALRTFQSCLAGIDNSTWPPHVAWAFSGLTPNGSPLEWCFSSRSNALRYTLEAAGPELENSLRLNAACTIISRLGHAMPSLELLRHWHGLQAGSLLQWGAWIGVRNAAPPARDEHVKLYLEVPSTSSWRPPLKHPFPGGRLLLIGFQPSNGRIEYYFRKPQMGLTDLDLLLNLLPSPHSRQAIRSVFAELSELPLESACRWLAPAYSVAQSSNSPFLELSLFVRARNVGPMPLVRQKIMEAIQRSGRTSSPYIDLFASVPAQLLPDHGAITLTLDADGQVDMRIGVSATAMANAGTRRKDAAPKLRGSPYRIS